MRTLSSNPALRLVLLMAVGAMLWTASTRTTYADAPAADRDLQNPMQFFAKMNHMPTRKLGRGFSNLLFGFIEVPKSMVDVKEDYGHGAGFTWGFFLGMKRFVLREVCGLYEIATFYMRQGVIIEPEFPFMPEQQIRWRVQHPVQN